MRRGSALVLFLCGVSTFSVTADVRAIIEGSVLANEKDWKASPEYSYLERDRDQARTKTYRVVMLLGSPYNYLVAVNGKPIPLETQERERQKLV
jgi:hypothetical protein